MDKLDKKLLEKLQHNFPVTKKPFHKIAKDLNTEPQEVIKRVQKLKQKGYIRRISPIIDSRKIGLTGTLVAMKVPENQIEETAKTINQYIEVSHNYQRNHQYNLWFTLSTTSRQKIDEIIKEIKQKTGIKEIIELPSIKMYKIGVSFSFTDK
ncbi:AsnC family transcriptional regulator [Methanonatronarchaeum sp. AMET-Sl]|uniref:siroheme decarboxylase subunit alpha n=1 Tax=Methanonatronarchaeum sp. AMET-Sl TaxID=3037654 RepID=UPI00244DAB98|nr:AsnC family transcriptional regulator [Methanonatronarchaeum sp. AMET-Sl]WGI16830.1 AsnC family transcriptional regulator [Methanonatronarchaeum sp. AMET-Sl]